MAKKINEEQEKAAMTPNEVEDTPIGKAQDTQDTSTIQAVAQMTDLEYRATIIDYLDLINHQLQELKRE